jgi:ribosomal protein L25 (general stress protein Ctc)
MSEKITISGESREETGKANSRSLRSKKKEEEIQSERQIDVS